MRFIAAIPTFLALLSLVSAKIIILSPLRTTIWKHGGLYTVKWRIDSDSLYTALDLYLMCEHKSSTSLISAIEKGVSPSTTSLSFSASFNHKCDGYFVKFIAFDSCGIKEVLFSHMFSITMDGKALYRPLVCDVQAETEIPASTLEPASESATDTPKEETPQEPTLPEDNTPTLDQPQSPSDPTKNVEEPSKDTEPTSSESEEPQKPVSPEPDSVSPTSSETGAPDKTPDKKPGDIDNSGSLVTFKLFGILLSVIIAFLYY